MALSNVTFEALAGDKVGIVGRTGAGKSSIGSALFRLYELCSGTITIDGIDIASVQLQTLRSRLTIIPQDPVLFKGSLRYNLDPDRHLTNAQLNDALAKVHMLDRVSSLPKGVDTKNVQFSTGERQLLCMARAILRRSKVLMLDEATASIDGQSLELVMKTVREQFADCTVLTIAHRIETVIKCCQKVLVIDSGRVVEYDSPDALLDDHESLFAQMAAATVQLD